MYICFYIGIRIFIYIYIYTDRHMYVYIYKYFTCHMRSVTVSNSEVVSYDSQYRKHVYQILEYFGRLGLD